MLPPRQCTNGNQRRMSAFLVFYGTFMHWDWFNREKSQKQLVTTKPSVVT